MRQLAGVVAMVAVCCGLSWAEKREAKKAPPFQPVQVVSTVETYYPPKSVAFGTVVLEVTIEPGGEIQDVKVIRDIASLTEEAERAVKQWEFKPARLDGHPVATPVVVAFTFSQPTIRRG